MKTVNVHQAKTTLSKLLQQVEEEGEHIRIARNGKPVAELIPLPKKKNILRPHPSLKAIAYEDPMAPLDPDDWPGV
jgi:prevent-host-death family protein